MNDLRKQFEDDGTWVDLRAKAALPILISLAKSGRRLTYRQLDQEIAHRLDVRPLRVWASYGKVLEKAGQLINQLSDLWDEEIPPPTILIYNTNTGLPSTGVDGFLGRYVTESERDKLTEHNRAAMIERATNAVFNYDRWDEVAAVFGLTTPSIITETDPIPLLPPSTVQSGESEAHRRLKEYVASNPALVRSFGHFGAGQIEVTLLSGDEVDVLFQNEQQTLAVEVKAANAPTNELTRGLFQCVKYRTVLRAMHDIAGELFNVQAVLVTPQTLPDNYVRAAQRLNVPVLNVSIEADEGLSNKLNDIEAKFHQAMIDAYQAAKRDCKYNATYFLRMVNEYGGLEAAKRLLASDNTSDGFGTLLLCGRPDLTVEAHVLKAEFRVLFTSQEIEIATQRLQGTGYKFEQ